MVLPLTSVWTTGVMSVVMCVEKDVRTHVCCRVCGRRDGRGSVVHVVAHGPAAPRRRDYRVQRGMRRWDGWLGRGKECNGAHGQR